MRADEVRQRRWRSTPAACSASTTCRLVGARSSGRFSMSQPADFEYPARAGEPATSMRRKRRAPLPTTGDASLMRAATSCKQVPQPCQKKRKEKVSAKKEKEKVSKKGEKVSVNGIGIFLREAQECGVARKLRVEYPGAIYHLKGESRSRTCIPHSAACCGMVGRLGTTPGAPAVGCWHRFPPPVAKVGLR